MIYGNLELILDTRAAADIWIELHKTIREGSKPPQWEHPDLPEPDWSSKPEPLSLSERQLYEALTERFNSGLQSMS